MGKKSKLAAAKRERRILPVEFAKLSALGSPLDAAHEKFEDATLAYNEAKAAYETVVVPYRRYGQFLVKKYRLGDGEEINTSTGIIQPKAAPAS